MINKKVQQKDRRAAHMSHLKLLEMFLIVCARLQFASPKRENRRASVFLLVMGWQLHWNVCLYVWCPCSDARSVMEMRRCDDICVYLCSSCRRTTFSFPSFIVVAGKHSATVQHNREGEERERGGEEREKRIRGEERGRASSRGREASSSQDSPGETSFSCKK